MSDYDKLFTELMKIEEILAKVKKKKGAENKVVRLNSVKKQHKKFGR